MAPEAFYYPPIVGLLLALLGWARGREEGSTLRRGIAWPSAFAWGGGFVAAYYGVKANFASWPPQESSHWLFWAMVLATPIGALHGCKRSIPHFFLGVALMGAFVWFVSSPLREGAWELTPIWLPPLIYTSIGALALLLHSDWVRAEPTGIRVPGTFALTLGGAAFVIGQSMSGSAHMLGGMALCGVLWMLLAAIRKSSAVTYGAVLPFVMALTGFLFIGLEYGSTPRWSAGLVLAAPLGMRIGGWLPNKKVSFVVGFLLTAGLLAGAAYLSMPVADPSDPYSDYR